MRVLAICVGISALSLLAQSTPDFDPSAWLVWGRQVLDGELHTIGGPSWKPFPVPFTTVFALAGDEVAPLLWLVAARTAGLLALVAAYRLTDRLAGRTAAIVATAGLALATDFLFNAARGDSEGFLVALTLWAIDLHLRDRRTGAFAAGVGAALIRPEVWPLLAAYGSWLLWRRRDARTAALVIGAGAAILAAWLVPEKIGSGDWLRAATRAQHPVDGSPGQSAFPFLFTFLNASIALAWPWYAGALKATADAWRERDRAVLAIAAGATAYMVFVGLGAEVGFTGNLRYVTVPAALLCVLGGIGLPRLAELVRGRGYAVPVAALAALAVAFSAGLLVRNAFSLAREQREYGTGLDRAIEVAGGEAAIKACGAVGVNHFGRQQLAYKLHMRQEDVLTGTVPPHGTVFGLEGTGAAEEGRPPVRARVGDWVIRQDCAGGTGVTPARSG